MGSPSGRCSSGANACGAGWIRFSFVSPPSASDLLSKSAGVVGRGAHDAVGLRDRLGREEGTPEELVQHAQVDVFFRERAVLGGANQREQMHITMRKDLALQLSRVTSNRICQRG